MFGGTYPGAAPFGGLLLQPAAPSDGTTVVTHTWAVVQTGRAWVDVKPSRTWAIPDEEP